MNKQIRELFEAWFVEHIIRNGNGIDPDIKFNEENNHYKDIWDDNLEPTHKTVCRQKNKLNSHWVSWQAAIKQAEMETIPKLDFELLQLAFKQKVDLLISCEIALADRDSKIESLQSELAKLKDSVIDICKQPSYEKQGASAELQLAMIEKREPNQWAIDTLAE